MVHGALSESELRAVEDVLDFIRRKNRLTPEEWEDFHAWVWVRLAETNYAILGKFEGRGALRKFLAVAFHRLLLDYRVAKWGRWRPSNRARNLGAEAEMLEFYLYRQGYSTNEAIQMMKLNHGSSLSEEELESIASQLPARNRPRELRDEWLERIASSARTPLSSLERKLTEIESQKAMDVLEALIRGLKSEERVILKMKFEQEFKLNEIATALGLEPKRFYRSFEKLLKKLRRGLEARGISSECIESLFPDSPLVRTGGDESVSTA